jgi:putative phage-type endonuclease
MKMLCSPRMHIVPTKAAMPRQCPVCPTSLALPADGVGVVQCPDCQTRFLADTRSPDDPLASLPKAAPQRLDMAQGTREWLELRRGLRMASETPAVLGLSPYSSALANLRKQKQGGSVFVNRAMQKGTAQEPVARAAYAKLHGRMEAAMFVDGDYGCSLDGISDDGETLLEIKTPYRGRAHERWRLAAAGNATPYDHAQIQHQLMACRAKRAHLWVWDAEGCAGKLVEIFPEPEFWRRIRIGWDAFWPTIGALRR